MRYKIEGKHRWIDQPNKGPYWGEWELHSQNLDLADACETLGALAKAKDLGTSPWLGVQGANYDKFQLRLIPMTAKPR